MSDSSKNSKLNISEANLIDFFNYTKTIMGVIKGAKIKKKETPEYAKNSLIALGESHIPSIQSLSREIIDYCIQFCDRCASKDKDSCYMSDTILPIAEFCGWDDIVSYVSKLLTNN